MEIWNDVLATDQKHKTMINKNNISSLKIANPIVINSNKNKPDDFLDKEFKRFIIRTLNKTKCMSNGHKQ